MDTLENSVWQVVREKKCEDKIGEQNAALEKYPNKSYDRVEQKPKGGVTNEKTHRENTTGIIFLHVIFFSVPFILPRKSEEL